VRIKLIEIDQVYSESTRKQTKWQTAKNSRLEKWSNNVLLVFVESLQTKR